ncbi:TnsA endonuclease N-terminal domain-containing protein [Cytobacillus kochii]|uniref:TnsA endonuclease N-terminal domain-containing protein n=1 Tax=Cytobacillus kochii TaxID=859143 RepID=UPI00203E7EFF|nr:TnsA endonuclease N-terminal domain-containing protein [Cytobacillus kochii]MCM3325012.1 TnsA endonuclease N-terminal domain-containing protein [Cytobacillus kochii]MCM3347397.1 TnsA endonuclease N-terminal domain-containing protein [Cytobacillus kochii]
MPKRQTGWTEKKIARYYKEGRGQGELGNYRPWLTIQDVPSNGRAHRDIGWKTKREHHLLSDIEYNYFCLLDWSDDVIDIREQFPINRENTTIIAEHMNIKHPLDSSTQTPVVMTTDFLITLRHDSKITYMARTIKPEKELNNTRVIEKFGIERTYWENQDVDWAIVTEKDLPKTIIDNIKWLRSSYILPDTIDSSFITILLEKLKTGTGTILNNLKEFDEIYHLENGTAISLFRHTLANKLVKVDITKKFDLTADLSTIEVTSLHLEEKRWAT